jgi:hypothetical protein
MFLPVVWRIENTKSVIKVLGKTYHTQNQLRVQLRFHEVVHPIVGLLSDIVDPQLCHADRGRLMERFTIQLSGLEGEYLRFPDQPRGVYEDPEAPDSKACLFLRIGIIYVRLLLKSSLLSDIFTVQENVRQPRTIRFRLSFDWNKSFFC